MRSIRIGSACQDHLLFARALRQAAVLRGEGVGVEQAIVVVDTRHSLFRQILHGIPHLVAERYGRREQIDEMRDEVVFKRRRAVAGQLNQRLQRVVGIGISFAITAVQVPSTCNL
jgi:hypothetical protein